MPPLLTGRRLEHGRRALLRNTRETRSLTCGSFGGRRVQLSEGKLGLRRCPSPARHLKIAFHSGVETHHPSSCRIFDAGRLGLRPPAVDPRNVLQKDAFYARNTVQVPPLLTQVL